MNVPNLSSASPVLTIWGDPVAGRALTLLLRGSGYKAKFLSASPSSEPLSLKDTQLLVLTPTPQLSIKERECLLAELLEDRLAATNLLVLELITPSERTSEGLMQSELRYSLSWPCRFEEMEQRIEGILVGHFGDNGESAGSTGI
jgi:hypothetical protein